MFRSGDHRFMPLLLSKAHEVLPKVISPMLQNVPDSVAMNTCSVDIFDGFGNGGMAHPPAMMDTYEKKYTPPDSGSSQGGSTNGNDMHSPFVSSPMSPAGDLPSGLSNNSYNPISEVMMNQMGQATAVSHPPTSDSPQTPHLRQPPTPLSPMPTLSAHMQNGLHTPIEQPPTLAQNFGQPFNQGLPFMNGMGQNMNLNGASVMPRQVPNRASSFAMSPNPQLQAMGDFQSLQRANSDFSAMGSLDMRHGLPTGAQMDFSGGMQ